MKKTNWWIVGTVAFALLFLGKSCSSCRNQRTNSINKAQTEQVMIQKDSINRVNESTITMLEDSIKVLNTRIVALEEQKNMLESGLKSANETNSQLIKTNHNLSKNKQ